MAGMFYSLQEVAEKLNKKPEEVKQIIRQGRLREFRDGPNLLFKVDEVEALMAELGAMPSEEAPIQEQPEITEEEITLEPETPEQLSEEVELTSAEEPESAEELELLSETDSEPQVMDDIAKETEPPSDELLLQEDTEQVTEAETSEEEPILAEDTVSETEAESEEPILAEGTVSETEAEIEEPILAEDTISETKAEPEEPILAEDTLSEAKAESEKTVLPEDTLAEAKVEPEEEEILAEDTMDETQAATAGVETAEEELSETAATADEASLEAIEEDVNLDTFGSGSGLLDLSLQADDTSLGGILDEIYAPEGAEKQASIEAGSAMDVTAEADQIMSETMHPELGAPAVVQMQVEPEPDTLSNAFGIVLFLPLLAIVYTAIAAISGFSGATPAILQTIQGIIWYVMIGVAVAAGIIVGIAFVLSGGGGKPAKKKAKA